jgi:hypothetical protein
MLERKRFNEFHEWNLTYMIIKNNFSQMNIARYQYNHQLFRIFEYIRPLIVYQRN